MLGMILGILKIIGIVLLVILLVVIALLLIILFVPIRYRAHATIERTDLSDENVDFKDKIKADAGFNWLLHLVRGGIGYPENTSFYLKVLFFTILPRSEEKKRKAEEKQIEKDRKKSDKKIEQAMENAANAVESEPLQKDDIKDPEGSENSNKDDNTTQKEGETQTSGDSQTSDNPQTSDNAHTSDESNASGDGPQGENASNDNISSETDDNSGSFEGSEDDEFTEDNEKGDQEPSYDDADIYSFFDFIEKMVDILENVFDYLEKPEEAAEKAFYTISKACAKIEMIKNLLESPTFERAYERAKKDLFLILRHIMPKKIDADILLGLGDPASTAQLLAGINVINTFNDYDIWMEPDFDDKVVEADIDIKGRVALWRLLLSAARVYFNKDIRKVWKRINRIMNK